MVLPSILKATERTTSECPSRSIFLFSWPVSMSHRLKHEHWGTHLRIMNCGGRNMRLRLKVFVQPPYSTREHIVKYDNQKGLDSLSQGWRIAWPYGPRGYIIKAEARSYRMVLSFEALTIVLPSGLMATLLTRFECPSSVVLNRPVPVSHTL